MGWTPRCITTLKGRFVHSPRLPPPQPPSPSPSLAGSRLRFLGKVMGSAGARFFFVRRGAGDVGAARLEPAATPAVMPPLDALHPVTPPLAALPPGTSPLAAPPAVTPPLAAPPAVTRGACARAPAAGLWSASRAAAAAVSPVLPPSSASAAGGMTLRGRPRRIGATSNRKKTLKAVHRILFQVWDTVTRRSQHWFHWVSTCTALPRRSAPRLYARAAATSVA